MGLRFRKSFNLGGGFRVNLSKRGIGSSWGVKGFRIGTGPSGSRLYGSIPGTGLGWSTGVGSRRVGSSSAGSYRELLARQREAQRYAELERNRYEVQLYEERLNALTSLHREGWSRWDWSAVASTPRPVEPECLHTRETRALQSLESFKPRLIDKLLGVGRRRRRLQDALVSARSIDEQEYSNQLDAFQVELERWEWFQRVSGGVLLGEEEACQAVLDFLGPFQEFQELGSSLNVSISRSWCVEAWLTANDQSVVPAETIALTATGKLSRRKLSATKYWGLYQDHVCSAAIRIAREVFALLPIPIALVHIAYPWANSRTGLPDTYPVLSVAFDESTFSSLSLNAIDPSDSMENFEHRMKYKKTTGFAPIDLLSPDDLEITQA